MNIKWFQFISKKISSLLENKTSIKYNLPTKEELYFIEEFNQFLEAEDYLFCYQMIADGFNPKDSVKNKLDEFFLEKVIKDEKSS